MRNFSALETRTPLSLSDLQQIKAYLDDAGVFTPETVERWIEWFVSDMAIDTYYFLTTPVAEIARHILAISASDVVARHAGSGVAIQLVNEEQKNATYVVEDVPERVNEVEQRIQNRYPRHRIQSYRSRDLEHRAGLRFYVVSAPDPNGSDTSFEGCAAHSFLDRSLPETVERYREVWRELSRKMAPVIRISERNPEEHRIMVGLHGTQISHVLTLFSALFHNVDLPLNRRYVELFADDKVILSFYTRPLSEQETTRLSQELNAATILPKSELTKLFYQEGLSAQETLYTVAAAAFAHQFVSEPTEGYALLAQAITHNPDAQGILTSLTRTLTKNTFSTKRIAYTVLHHRETVRLLYRHFAALCDTGLSREGCSEEDELRTQITRYLDREVPYHRDRTILSYFMRFNELVLRTNFFKPNRVAIAFRMKNGFLEGEEFSEEPYGVYFTVGRGFTGFHVRFRDIARGGIRIIRSRTADAWARNIDTVFLENYNLAATQQRKNKDIPEGGSKGVILLNPEYADVPSAGTVAFRSYADAILDLLLANDKGATHEVLFLGPDEGSAELMSWAAEHARGRGYPFWKGFTTGKPLSQGGIPHDRYGMTTRSVHTYATLLLEKLGLKENDVTKVQTGGPDGDLGSNEILISSDRTIAVVDGSGVLYDPAGIDRQELRRLATQRKMVEHFDTNHLGKAGFFVGIGERDRTLPDGTVCINGEEFRNRFHLTPYATCDLFVPCGGRPSAINVTNWEMLLHENGSPRVRAIVEGANLFITPEARLRLEEAGIIVFRDASTNKGGVTSSSLEVFAGLALRDEEFSRLMCIPDDTPRGANEGTFRQAYVDEVIARVEGNARAEFELMWEEHQRSKRPFTVISDEVSAAINRITDAVNSSVFRNHPHLRKRVLSEYTPTPLLEQVGVDAITSRVPANYLDAIIASRIASQYVYRYGLHATEVDFARYIEELME